MQAWTPAAKVGLGIAACAVFAAVMLLAGRDDTRAQQPPPSRLGESAGSIADPAARLAVRDDGSEIRARVPSLSSTPDERPEPDSPPTSDIPDVADLSRQVMTVAETTAEEDEQRGDAIRRLSSVAGASNVQPLIYALRNDVDIRNRILAINGLRRAALAGNPDRAISDALLEASRSGDDVIASQARQALAELERAQSR
jgi:hypothetical protein